MSGLRLVPVSLSQANEHVAAWHRHNRPVVGHKFSVGAAADGVLHAVAIVGRPVARAYEELVEAMTRLVLRAGSVGPEPEDTAR